MLGLTFGCNNSIYFSTNAFLPDYLSSHGRADLIGAGLGWLNGAQFLATFILMVAAERLTGRTWPYLVFGLMTIASLVGIIFATGAWVVAFAAMHRLFDGDDLRR